MRLQMFRHDADDNGPAVVCSKHGRCVLGCLSPCNTKRLVKPPVPIEEQLDLLAAKWEGTAHDFEFCAVKAAANKLMIDARELKHKAGVYTVVAKELRELIASL